MGHHRARDWVGVDHLGAPVRGVLAAGAVLGFDCHQLCDLAAGIVEGVVRGFRKMRMFGTYCCSARRSSRSFPTSWSRIRTSLASALLKSFRYL